jgi:hypothetical protein
MRSWAAARVSQEAMDDMDRMTNRMYQEYEFVLPATAVARDLDTNKTTRHHSVELTFTVKAHSINEAATLLGRALDNPNVPAVMTLVVPRTQADVAPDEVDTGLEADNGLGDL